MNNKKEKNFADFQNLIFFYKNKKLLNTIFLNFDHSKTFPGVTWCPTKKFGPDRFSCFDVYWIQTNRQKQTNRQTSQIYIYMIRKSEFAPKRLNFFRHCFRQNFSSSTKLSLTFPGVMWVPSTFLSSISWAVLTVIG